MNQTYFQKRNDFSEAHYKLPRQYAMFDIDVMRGEWLKLHDNISTKQEATYTEFRCLKFDKDDNRFNLDRVKHVAIFELKYKWTPLLREKAKTLNPGEPLWAIFMTAKKLQCRFFLVVATEGKSPFHFIEYCTVTNQMKPYKTLEFNYKTDDAGIINRFWSEELKITS